LTDTIVLLAGLVAMVLNLILPQEEKPLEEHHDVEHGLDNTETGSTHKKERSDV
jgi:xanthine/uracil permease